MTPGAPGSAMSARRGRPWKLRRASMEDLSLLVDHRHRMWTDVGNRTVRQVVAHDRVYRRWMRPRLKSREVIVFLVEVRKIGPVASGGVWFRSEQPRPGMPQTSVPYLFSMYTRPEFRGRGFARRITREAIRISRRRGYARVVLHAAPLGRPVYQRLGFERSWEMRLGLHR